MSAKITVIVYIVISFEIGILLLLLPWSPWWHDNFFLYFISGKLHAPWVATFLTHKAVRGAVTGIGVLNILAGLYDIFTFRESVQKLTSLDEKTTREISAIESKEPTVEPANTAQTDSLSDHRPPVVPPQN
ncbi:MAG: hypothetical protein SF097_08130 [Acidobacteriota bacterium]|nr:hypothetical protein [Acidobacteriota bacterium]